MNSQQEEHWHTGQRMLVSQTGRFCAVLSRDKKHWIFPGNVRVSVLAVEKADDMLDRLEVIHGDD